MQESFPILIRKPVSKIKIESTVVAEPGKVIQSAFAVDTANANANANANDTPCANQPNVVDTFLPYLQVPELKAQVPSINMVALHNIPSGTLVRYKGMVTLCIFSRMLAL